MIIDPITDPVTVRLVNPELLLDDPDATGEYIRRTDRAGTLHLQQLEDLLDAAENRRRERERLCP